MVFRASKFIANCYLLQGRKAVAACSMLTLARVTLTKIQPNFIRTLHCLPRIKLTDEVSKVFNFFSNNFRIGSYKHLLMAPFFMRKKLVKYIQREIKNAEAGKEAYIILKLNSLVDQEVIKKLYQASQA